MSALDSFGSQDYEENAKPQDQQSPLSPSIAPVDQVQVTIQTITSLLQRTEPAQRQSGLKMLLAMFAKGHDVSSFTPSVVQFVTDEDPQTRHYAQIFLEQYADQSVESFMLCVNTFQKTLSDTDPIVRANSLKMLSSLHKTEILPVLKDAINQVAGDPSPYVKKEAAFAIIKASELDPNEIEGFLPIIERIMKDEHPISFSGAIAAYWTLCPDNIELLHPHFKFICSNITKFDEFAQVFIIRAMTIYTRYCFKNPINQEDQNDEEDNVNFWDENPTKEQVGTDNLLLIFAVKKLLSSLSPAVVMAAANYLYYCAPSSHVSAIAKPLIRLLYDENIVAELALSSIVSFASNYYNIFIPHLKHFFVRKNDAPKIKELKLNMLSILAAHSSADIIMNELSVYTGSNDIEFAAEAVKTMGKTALCNVENIPICLVSLLRLMGRSEGKVLDEIVLVIAHILRLKRGTDDEAQALKHLCHKFTVIKAPTARAAVLSIVGDMHEIHPEFAPQLLRYIAQRFNEEPDEVRLQTLTLAAKLIICGTDSQVPMYILKISEHDLEFDIRDRAKLLVALIETKSEAIKSKIKSLLFPQRNTPNWIDSVSNFQVGTFSHYFNKEIGGYEPLPEWLPEDELPDESVRYPEHKLPDGTTVKITKEEIEKEDDLDINNFFSDDGDNEEEEENNGNKVCYSGDEEIEYYEYEEEEENNLDNFFK